ncbi:MAG TPA: YihY/virulence factor BrkB family protein, partial [bacterium]|nr:YihY/virulence factor BrkB family protein [bacterium]
MPSPWSLGGLTLVELGRRVWSAIKEDEVMDRAASLSYYFLFALFPTLLFLTSMLGLLPVPGLWDTLMTYAARVLPGDAATLVNRTVSEVLRGASGSLLSVGALAALWAASSGMASIVIALNIAYDVTDLRSWWLRRLIAIALTMAFSVFTLVALLLLVFGERIGEAVATWFGLGEVFALVWGFLQWPVAAFLVLTGITFVYYLAPAVKRRWHWFTPGSVFALLAWLATSFGLRVYLKYFGNYNATY